MKKSTFRLGFKIVRTAVCEKDIKFQKVWEKHSSQPITYEGGQLYFSNYTKCYTCFGPGGVPCQLYSPSTCSFGPGGVPCQLYSLAVHPTIEKIEDCVICYGSLEKIPVEHRGYRPSLLALKNTWLMRYDQETGEMLEQVYLSPSLKFKHLAWDTSMEYVVACTVQMDVRRQPQQEDRTLMVLAVFSVFPLGFVAMLEISTHVFGRDICSCMMSDGLLLIMHHNSFIRFYSFEHILKQGKLHSASLYRHCEELGGVVGTPPMGAPCQCHPHSLPRSVVSSEKCGALLVHWRHSLALHNDSTCQYCLKEDFVIKAPENTNSAVSQPSFTSSGRAVRRTARFSEDTLDDTLNTIQTVDYEDELDLIVTFVTVIKHGDIQAKVKVYDNETGRFIRDIELDEPWVEFSEHVVILDLDMIIHTVKQPGRKFSCYVHRLERTPNEPQVTQTKRTTQPSTAQRNMSHTASLRQRSGKALAGPCPSGWVTHQKQVLAGAIWTRDACLSLGRQLMSCLLALVESVS
ncbi:hypothetical protein LSAT2_030327 [Lamellibrachia satsuma]|nr:hypothetical protein LSAT2_030327 [Lamellibrachia satsuma]